MITLLYFLAVLAVLVISHEFGHFIAAKKSGMGVHEFGFGFPPRFIGIQFKKNNLKSWRIVWGNRELNESDYDYGTIYSLNWLPLGGFVRIKGENGEDASEKDSFGNKKFFPKAITLVAGVIMNVLVAAVLFSVGYMFGVPQNIDTFSDVSRIEDRRIEVLGTLDGKPAQIAGVLPGDQIIAINDFSKPRLREMQDYVDQHKNEDILFKIKRNNEIIEKVIHPAIYSETGRGGIGVSIAEIGTVKYGFFGSIFQGVKTTGLVLKEIIVSFYELVKGLIVGSGAKADVSGPVGVAVMTGRVARLGAVHLMQFMAMLSLNLAVFNILPIPALDGGRLLFLVIAKIRGREVSQKIEQIFHTVGFALLMLLVVFVTVRDISNFKNVIAAFFHRLF